MRIPEGAISLARCEMRPERLSVFAICLDIGCS